MPKQDTLSKVLKAEIVRIVGQILRERIKKLDKKIKIADQKLRAK